MKKCLRQILLFLKKIIFEDSNEAAITRCKFLIQYTCTHTNKKKNQHTDGVFILFSLFRLDAWEQKRINKLTFDSRHWKLKASFVDGEKKGFVRKSWCRWWWRWWLCCCTCCIFYLLHKNKNNFYKRMRMKLKCM